MTYQRVRPPRPRMMGIPGIPGMGDGPITDPRQVDDTIDAGTVGPTRVDCSALPDDSPWKRPGQVCAPTMWDRMMTFLSNAITPSTPPPPPVTVTAPDPAPAPPPTGSPSATPFLVLGGLAAAYYLLRKKKRK